MFMTMCQVVWWANSRLILMTMVVFVHQDEVHDMNSGLIFMTVRSVSWRASCHEQWFATYDDGCVCSAGRGPWCEEGPGAAAEDSVRHADHPAENPGPQHACHGKVGTFHLAGYCLSVCWCVRVCPQYCTESSGSNNMHFGKVCRAMCQREVGPSAHVPWVDLSLCLRCPCVCLSIDV